MKVKVFKHKSYIHPAWWWFVKEAFVCLYHVRSVLGPNSARHRVVFKPYSPWTSWVLKHLSSVLTALFHGLLSVLSGHLGWLPWGWSQGEKLSWVVNTSHYMKVLNMDARRLFALQNIKCTQFVWQPQEEKSTYLPANKNQKPVLNVSEIKAERWLHFYIPPLSNWPVFHAQKHIMYYSGEKCTFLTKQCDQDSFSDKNSTTAHKDIFSDLARLPFRTKQPTCFSQRSFFMPESHSTGFWDEYGDGLHTTSIKDGE